jgi:hypothetical protein
MATKKELKKVRRLPSGKTTTSQTVYLRSWKRVANPLAKAMKWKLMCFDPSFLFEIESGRTLHLPTDVVIALNQVITKKI